jgi:hypothetical protein
MGKFLSLTIFVILLIATILIYWFYFNTYSNGERKGILIKITNKGNLFKTYEGEMWLSCRNTVNIEKFFFSVSDKAVADSLMKLQDECINVNYSEYRKTIPWRGDSKYIITSFQKTNK